MPVLGLVGLVVVAVGSIDRLKALFQQDSSIRTSADGYGQGLVPEEILRERYARGELSREEYLKAKETLRI